MTVELASATAVYGSLVLAAVAVVLLIVLLLRRPPDLTRALEDFAAQQAAATERAVRALREEFVGQSRNDRQELAGALNRFGGALNQQMASIAGVQNTQIDRFAEQLLRLTEANEKRLGEVRSTLEARLGEVRGTLEQRLRELQSENAGKLEEMRRTVDEKLHATLEQRLGESFRLVSDRLEAVHKGLGEMQALASDVGDLKRVLTNVKTRGVWGEVQLAALLEQMLVPEQYAANVPTVPGSGERVEFAIRLPGSTDDAPVWLPIDAKFPREDYERLMHAHEQADAAGAETALRQLEQRLRLEAKTIRDKYLSPPHTTDFALMFLPVEGLYAEAVRRPGLVDELQRVHRVVVAGPTTLAAILSSLQMGFRTLAVEKRSSEVWQLLGAVKTEFGKFGDMLAKAREQVDKASKTLGSYETRSRAIERRLREVQALPEASARAMLGGDAGESPPEPRADEHDHDNS